MATAFNEYVKIRKAFFNKHHNNFKTYTSPIDEYDTYHKTYVFNDNAQWSEVLGPYYETVNVMVKEVPIKVNIKLFRVEYYSTDDATSRYYYEEY